MSISRITSPDDPALEELCQRLAELSPELDRTGEWPAEQLRLCAEYGVFQWFLPPEWGGLGWDGKAIARGYFELSGACLTTTFIITQRSGACRRIVTSGNEDLKQRLLPDLASGASFATVGISHLTTSRRHLHRPVMRAERRPGGFVLGGISPWVTGAAHAEHIVVGASVLIDNEPTGEEVLVVVPTDLPGVVAAAPIPLTALSASHTGEIRLDEVFVEDNCVISGPAENVMGGGDGASTGGLQTSTLALGLARGAIRFLESEAAKRVDLTEPLDALRNDFEQLQGELFAAMTGSEACLSKDQLRKAANSLALRASHAALVAAKGTGFIMGHPAGRWCREALFFLVWSCPQQVIHANLCELAGTEVSNFGI